jgi:homoserine O-acetyltransferase
MRSWRILSACALCAALSVSFGAARAQAPAAAARAVEGDYVIHDFHFASGETLPELRLHYTILGKPRRDAQGKVNNAVLILHGTGGSGRSLLNEHFAGVLYGKGQLLDTSKYFIILPDGIGHGKSSKPSDALHARFPQYGYADMVAAQHALLLQGLQVDHLRLVMGTSMGCMHTFMWGETWPQMIDAMMPLACNALQIAGRNRVWRQMIVQAIKADPDWKGGDYAAEPLTSLRTAADILVIAGSASHQMQKALPAAALADAYLDQVTARELKGLDANDLIYALDSSRDYDPSARLGDISAYVMWVNSADDFINPPELGLAEQAVTRIRRGRFVLLPIGPDTHGHGTHTYAVAWKQYLADLLRESARAGDPA